MSVIEAYLKRRNIKVKDLAEIIGITREHLYAIISGRRKPHPTTALDIEIATGGEIKAEWLIFPEKHQEEIRAYIEGKKLEGVER